MIFTLPSWVGEDGEEEGDGNKRGSALDTAGRTELEGWMACVVKVATDADSWTGEAVTEVLPEEVKLFVETACFQIPEALPLWFKSRISDCCFVGKFCETSEVQASTLEA